MSRGARTKTSREQLTHAGDRYAEDRARNLAKATGHDRPEWMQDRSLLPKRPPAKVNAT